MSVQNTTASPINVDVFIYNEFGAQVATKNYTNVPAFSSVHLDLETQGAGMAWRRASTVRPRSFARAPA